MKTVKVYEGMYDGPNGSFFYFDTNSQFRIPNSQFRITNSEFRILNSEFRISKKNVVYRNFVFGNDTSGSVHGVGPFDLQLEQFKQ